MEVTRDREIENNVVEALLNLEQPPEILACRSTRFQEDIHLSKVPHIRAKISKNRSKGRLTDCIPTLVASSH